MLPPLLTAEDGVSLLQLPDRLSNKPYALNRRRFWVLEIKGQEYEVDFRSEIDLTTSP